MQVDLWEKSGQIFEHHFPLSAISTIAFNFGKKQLLQIQVTKVESQNWGIFMIAKW